MRQTLLVRGFQQPRTEDSVNFDGTADHAIGMLVEFVFVLFVSFVVKRRLRRLTI